MFRSSVSKTQSQENRPAALCEPHKRLRTEPIKRSEVLGPINALADESRLRILELLAVYGGLSVEEVSIHLALRQSSVVRQLRQLRKTRFISEEQADGAATRYRLNQARIGEVAHMLSRLLSMENAKRVLNDVRPRLPAALRPYLDHKGVITNWPTEKKEQIVLDYLITKFTSGEQYTEKQINTLLTAWHTCNDTCYLRRRLVDFGLLARTTDGAIYWRAE